MRRRLSPVLAAAARRAARMDLAKSRGNRALDRRFDRELAGLGHDRLVRRALLQITPGAGARRGSLAAFLEQVQYNGRRLAKLNLTPREALDAFDLYIRLAPGQAPVDGLRWAVALALDDSFYQVHAEEARAFFRLSEAEMRTPRLEDLIPRCVGILAEAVQARAGCWQWVEPGGRRLRAPRYIEAGKPGQEAVAPSLRGRFQSYWIVPLAREGRAAAAVQFGFSGAYPWLPREIQLIQAGAERCLAAGERARLIEDLENHREKLRKLAAHTLQVEENERRRISRELHDEAGQSMMFMRMQLELLECDLVGHPAAGRAREVRGVMEQTIAEVRRVIADLSPAALERFGLWAAVRRLALRMREGGADVRLSLPRQLPELAPACEIALYRVLQESCNNVLKHASAKTLKIRVATADGWIEMTVADDGIGFDPAVAARKLESYGLSGMAERLALVGGRFSMASRPGRGATIRVRVPSLQEKPFV